MRIGGENLGRPWRSGERDNGRWPWASKADRRQLDRSRLFRGARNHHRV